ncbi:redox-regulated ATPase YchF [Candidatus Borrarchaeum sp.]|uniref:redox-regulated ATPase YchF n=1 Tax=Candidatus Borrarchaeum sp. TaxID=2846742 RepID=UPI00257F46F6|nr:redox-regulated ATPase YchF [Candidatus Borrarchaeum sp.]
MIVGIVGKPSSGKTSFLNAACLTDAKVASYPFTTIEPNQGIAYVRKPCPHVDLGVEDTPVNSLCMEGIRHIPVELIDVAGLVPDAWQGKGLGNQFLDDLRQADVLIHVLDASGSIDADGQPIEAGSYDPKQDISFLEREINMWFLQIIQKDWNRLTRHAESARKEIDEPLADKLSGLGITRSHIRWALREESVSKEKPVNWSDEELFNFVEVLRKVSKPMIIVANKVDMSTSEKYLNSLLELEDYIVVPTCALCEYALKKLDEKDVIEYKSGEKSFKVNKSDVISDKEKASLERIQTEILEKYGSTGVQAALEKAVFELLDMIAVYPVHDTTKFADSEGRVLPDVYLVKRGTTAKEFAGKIHTDLAETFIHAVDARTGKRLGENHELSDGDIIKIVSAKGLK